VGACPPGFGAYERDHVPAGRADDGLTTITAAASRHRTVGVRSSSFAPAGPHAAVVAEFDADKFTVVNAPGLWVWRGMRFAGHDRERRSNLLDVGADVG
jgi:hypothetical protein